MELKTEHLRFENKLKELSGHVLMNVEYLEIDYQLEEPSYKTQYENIHSVDFSILITTNQGHVEFFWDDQFFQYGVGARINKPTVFSNYKKWNINHDGLWSGLVGSTIETIQVDWETVKIFTENSVGTEYLYPQSIRIDFENQNSIFISAAEFLSEKDKTVQGFCDNLTVTNSESIAREVKMIH
ncbi:MAG: hypothetical protein MI810_13875 [Flavobacteriales bacterium]|nr:hypothetical protein [Flavobacteriales bacterium]